jgi:hypothetical protein
MEYFIYKITCQGDYKKMTLLQRNIWHFNEAIENLNAIIVAYVMTTPSLHGQLMEASSPVGNEYEIMYEAMDDAYSMVSVYTVKYWK